MGNATQKEVNITRSTSSSTSSENSDYFTNKSDLVSLMLVWPNNSRNVSVIGSFNNWKEPIPMTYNEEDKCFLVVLTVSSGKHIYRFLVDGKEQVDPKQKTIIHTDGRLVNVIEHQDKNLDEVSEAAIKLENSNKIELIENKFLDEKNNIENGELNGISENPFDQNLNTEVNSLTQSDNIIEPKKAFDLVEYQIKKRKAKLFSGEWGQIEQEFPITKKAPPPLPPHIKYSNVLNVKVKKLNPLVVPLHVSVNHIYFSKLESNNMEIIGVSQRYKEKFTTIVIFKPRNNFQDE